MSPYFASNSSSPRLNWTYLSTVYNLADTQKVGKIRVKQGLLYEKSMLNLYQEALMDHYRNPRNRGLIKDADFSSGRYNPACGDAVSMAGIIQGGRVKDCSFEGKGCVISQATASMLTQKAAGMALSDIQLLNADAILKLIGMRLGPTRLKCALLPLEALKEGVSSYKP